MVNNMVQVFTTTLMEEARISLQWRDSCEVEEDVYRPDGYMYYVSLDDKATKTHPILALEVAVSQSRANAAARL